MLPPITTETPLLSWLLAALAPMNRTRVKQLLHQGRVQVNGTPVTRHDHVIRPGDIVTVARSRLVEPGRSVPIVYEDEALIVIDKPSGLLTVATESEKLDTAFARLSALLAARDAGRPYVVHRLDRETSGLLLFARTVEGRDRLQKNWEEVEKTYLAVVEGKPRPPEGVLDNYLAEGKNMRMKVASPEEGKHSVTRYRLLANRRPYSLVEVGLLTGRKHQIRVHLAGLGCPVIGDTDYGARTNRAGRLGLHAWKLALPHPVTGQRVELESPLPEILWKR
jgi:23S rRNA pseudouridine1911/1915/1917 synthase